MVDKRQIKDERRDEVELGYTCSTGFECAKGVASSKQRICDELLNQLFVGNSVVQHGVYGNELSMSLWPSANQS